MPPDHHRARGQAALRLSPLFGCRNQSAAEGADAERRPRRGRTGVLHVPAPGIRGRSAIAGLALEYPRLEGARTVHETGRPGCPGLAHSRSRGFHRDNAGGALDGALRHRQPGGAVGWPGGDLGLHRALRQPARPYAASWRGATRLDHGLRHAHRRFLVDGRGRGAADHARTIGPGHGVRARRRPATGKQ